MMEIERDDAGDLWFRGMSPLHADTLLHVPEWLNNEDPRVRARLLPQAYTEPEDEQQWRRLGADHLEHLFASRARIVGKDLESLVQDGPVTYTFCIRKAHANAWLSSLNAARLALFELHELDDVDLERDPSELGSFEKELALVRIHVMALMQELLIEAETG